MHKGTGVIAAGHRDTANAAAEILRAGGNAYDAAVAAHLAACVAEPVLSSLGGGGFLLAKTAAGKKVLYDFFVHTPRKANNPEKTDFYPITADFGTVEQEFHIGHGSLTTPGTVRGLFEIYRDLCTIPIKQLIEPAIALARNGVKLNRFQAYVLDIIKPIYLANDEIKKQYESRTHSGTVMQEGEIIVMKEFADLLENLSLEGDALFYEGEIARMVAEMCEEKGGHLTMDDFRHYRVIKRKPLDIKYHNSNVIINPPPSSGGLLTQFALQLMNEAEISNYEPGTYKALRIMAEVQAATETARIESMLETGEIKDSHMLADPRFLSVYKKKIKTNLNVSRGTTHISICDGDGNLASLSTSNGEGSGIVIPGTGIVMNNMLGEEDLNPNGFHAWMCDHRMTSMMSPGILEKSGGTRVVFGSGGSNRIRTAILQVLVNLVDFGMDLQRAINYPRIHFEKGLLNIEHGYQESVVEKINADYPTRKIWSDKNLFFGGVHAVSLTGNKFDGAGDPRRGGVCLVVNQGRPFRTI
jgi:gamma-glutamyltranspeptidase / glutathione hydrolase